MMVLVPEIHPVNLPLYWLLSFFVRVRVLYLDPLCARVLGSRVEQLDLRRFMSSEEGWAFRSRAVERWQAFLPRVPWADWRVSYRGDVLDVSTKAKQELVRAFENAALLDDICRRQSRTARGTIVDSVESAYLARFDPAGDAVPRARAARWLSSMNIACDAVWAAWLNASSLLLVLGWLVGGVLARVSPRRRTLGTFRILYQCDNLAELFLAPDQRSITWLIDDQHVRADEVLFLLPTTGDQRLGDLQERLRETPYHALTTPQLYRRLPLGVLFSALCDIARLGAGSLLQPVPGLKRLMMTRYLIRIARFGPVARHVKPAQYLESDSSVGVEDAAIVYLNRLGVSTVMFHTSAMLLYFTKPGGIDVREAVSAHILASDVACWSRACARFFAAHPQDGVRLTVVGPIMPGAERILELGTETLRRRYGQTIAAQDAGMKYVSVFDNAPQVHRSWRFRSIRPYPEPFTEEYAVTFLRHMVQLLDDLPQVILLYKPKRNLALRPTDWFPRQGAAYRELVEAIRRHERGVVLPADINPWIPLSIADLCISVPGGSPTWHGLHHGIPGFFHDATGQMPEKEYPALQGLITHSYDMLRRGVQRTLWPADASEGPAGGDGVDLREFLGASPGENANAAFRKRFIAREPVERETGRVSGAVVREAVGTTR